MSATCYLVGTPIGNLKDITLRALEILKTVDAIACEDTRKASVLLNAYDIKKPLIRYDMHREYEGTAAILRLLDENRSVALISDAGMPGISDPGAVLVRRLRAGGYKVESVPGPTAVATAVSLAGLTQNGYVFAGFLPEKRRERDRITERLKNLPFPLVFYCAPHDLDDTLSYLYEKLGIRKLCVVKELTKLFETVYEGELGSIEIGNKKGEFVLIVDGASEGGSAPTDTDVETMLKDLINGGMSKSEAVKYVAKATNLPKNDIYAITLKL
jgi:16S rRNA (cytidine1402-2'-O)-methyltransferase